MSSYEPQRTQSENSCIHLWSISQGWVEGGDRQNRGRTLLAYHLCFLCLTHTVSFWLSFGLFACWSLIIFISLSFCLCLFLCPCLIPSVFLSVCLFSPTPSWRTLLFPAYVTPVALNLCLVFCFALKCLFMSENMIHRTQNKIQSSVTATVMHHLRS